MTLSQLISLSGLHFTCQVGGLGQMSSRLPPALPLQEEGWCGQGADGVLTPSLLPASWVPRPQLLSKPGGKLECLPHSPPGT